MVCVDFSLIGCDPKVSLLSAGIGNSFADRRKGLCVWGGGLENDFVDNSIRKNISLLI